MSDNDTIKRVKSEKGVFFYEKLNFRDHITKKVNIANRDLEIIFRSFTYMDKEMFLNLYKSMVRPHVGVVVVVNLFLHYLAAYGRLVQWDLFGTITQSTFTPDTLCACVVTTDLILTEPISALNVLHKCTQHFSLTLNAQILKVSTQHPQIDITYRI